LAGPFCSMLLGDMGAEIVKIETPGAGDPVRQQGVIRDGLSWYFAAFNRNKRSLTLNLRHAEGRGVLERLIAKSDVLVENFRPGVMAAIGFDELRLKALNPALVYCNLTGFGSSGPYRDRPSFDFIAQAMSGFMSVTGESGGPPVRAGPPIADLIAGLYGALGVCAALAGRGRTGEGETVGASLNNAMISILGLPGGKLSRDRRGARSQRQRPCDRLALWHVPHQGRRDRDRPEPGAILSAADRCARHA
jgi:crotonobetainyl-CoA:carnitine CoA-transferase CaiB-like acyl-CoA transferase